MFYPHTRQLGSQSGVQLNQLRDETDGFVTGNADQTVAIVGRFKRGRIDRPFPVNAATLRKKLGPPESLIVSALNEPYIHAYDAVNNGSLQAVISRLTTTSAVNQYAVFAIDPTTGAGTFTASATIPTANFVFYLQDLECFNDGVMLEVNALKNLDATLAQIASQTITLRVREPDGTLRYQVTGSLLQTAVDEFGQDYYIGTKLSQVTRNVTIVAAQNVSIATTAACYGQDATGAEKLSKTATALILFTEGGTGYTSSDYDRVILALETSQYDYGYAITAGSQATALISKLAVMNIRANRQLLVDVPGTLTVAAAAAFVTSLSQYSRYIEFYWAPLKSDDPVNGGKAIIGTSGLQAALRCGRNAQKNTYGLAAKNYPVAGKYWPLNRTSVEQLVTPSDYDLSNLADAKVNPVIQAVYNDGPAFVWYDSLTSAQTTGYQKLISVCEMSSSIDDMVVKAAKEFLQLPMDVAIRRTDAFLKGLFTGARASGWLVASTDPALGDQGWVYTVARNTQNPVDQMDITYGLHYDGVARKITVTQTLKK